MYKRKRQLSSSDSPWHARKCTCSAQSAQKAVHIKKTYWIDWKNHQTTHKQWHKHMWDPPFVSSSWQIILLKFLLIYTKYNNNKNNSISHTRHKPFKCHIIRWWWWRYWNDYIFWTWRHENGGPVKNCGWWNLVVCFQKCVRWRLDRNWETDIRVKWWKKTTIKKFEKNIWAFGVMGGESDKIVAEIAETRFVRQTCLATLFLFENIHHWFFLMLLKRPNREIKIK